MTRFLQLCLRLLKLCEPWSMLALAPILLLNTVWAPGSETGESAPPGSTQPWLILVVICLVLGFGRFVRVVWPLFQSSIAGLLISLQSGLLLWIVYGGAASMGMPGLFWHYIDVKRVLASAGLTVYVFWMLYVLYVRDVVMTRKAGAFAADRYFWNRLSGVLKRSGYPSYLTSKAAEATGVMRLAVVYTITAVPALVVLALPAVLPGLRPRVRGGVDWYWLGGILAGLSVVALLTATGHFIRALREMHRNKGEVADDSTAREIDPGINRTFIHIMVLLPVLFAFVIMLSPDSNLQRRLIQWEDDIPAALSLIFLLGSSATLAAFFGTWELRLRIPIVAGIVTLLCLGGALDYEVQMPGFMNYPSALQQLYQLTQPHQSTNPTSYANRGIVDLNRFQNHLVVTGIAQRKADYEERVRGLERWKRSFGSDLNGDKPILVVVATSGGALRAAVWTETVLGKLSQRIPDFRHHVRLITGASGGMLGAARFITSGNKLPQMPGDPLENGPESDTQKPPDYLERIASRAAFRDSFFSLIPWANDADRGKALESRFADFDKGIDINFRELEILEKEHNRPSIIFSPMMAEDGRRLLISNLPLADFTQINADAYVVESEAQLIEWNNREDRVAGKLPGPPPTPMELEYPSISTIPAIEFFKLFAGSQEKLKLATAVRMSATFPYVTSSIVLPTYPPRHVLDAGYYDNYGVHLACEWLAIHQEWIARHAGGVLLVQIRAFPNEKKLKFLDPGFSNAEATQGWDFLGSFLRSLAAAVLPFEGVSQARESSMYYRNDMQVRGVAGKFNSGDRKDFFRSVVFSCDTEPSDNTSRNMETLNWYMEPVEFENIRRNMNDLAKPGEVGGRARNFIRFKNLMDWWNQPKPEK